MSKKTIVIFEDNTVDANHLKAALEKQVPKSRVRVEVFSTQQKKAAEKRYEVRLLEELKPSKYGDIALIISDRDLSKTEQYIGLSETAISKVADFLSVPICLYARGETDRAIDKAQRWGEGRIILDFGKGFPFLAKQIDSIFSGFQLIEKNYLRIKSKFNSPAKILANILERPQLADKIALYSSGDQKMLNHFLRHLGKDNSTAKKVILPDKRIPLMIGYWLWESIIQFPGVLVNEIAAASYLNINPSDFLGNASIQKLFADAEYTGPFSEVKKMWWRGELNQIFEKNDCADGLSYVNQKLKLKVKGCSCHLAPKLKAGFYCIVREKPVSAENSVSNLSWIPAGADLARISTPDFDELGPWLGLF